MKHGNEVNPAIYRTNLVLSFFEVNMGEGQLEYNGANDTLRGNED